jgi:hypothetical protein
MERERIATLLEKYWQGETTLDDERALKEYFAGPGVPAEWQDQAVFFQYLEMQHQKVAPEDEEILSMLKDVEPEPARGGKQVRIWLQNAGKVAAVTFIVAAAAVFIRQDYESKKEKIDPVLADTFEDPQRAFEETKKMLMLVSRQFDKGKKHAQKLTVFDEATEKVQQLEREL